MKQMNLPVVSKRLSETTLLTHTQIYFCNQKYWKVLGHINFLKSNQMFLFPFHFFKTVFLLRTYAGLKLTFKLAAIIVLTLRPQTELKQSL